MTVYSVSIAISATVKRECVLTVVVPANPISATYTPLRATVKANVSRRWRRQMGWTRDTGHNIKTVGNRVGVLVGPNLLT